MTDFMFPVPCRVLDDFNPIIILTCSSVRLSKSGYPTKGILVVTSPCSLNKVSILTKFSPIACGIPFMSVCTSIARAGCSGCCKSMISDIFAIDSVFNDDYFRMTGIYMSVSNSDVSVVDGRFIYTSKLDVL